jgi:hypothetical protein
MSWHAMHVRSASVPEAWSGDVEVTKDGIRLCRGSEVSSSGWGRLGLVLAAGTLTRLS